MAMKWDGEWQITYEVFRDMGLAFAVVLVLIAILVVGWFGSYTTPLAIMIPIPLSLIGIIPAHAMAGAFFRGHVAVGFIAGAGIVVRNSIILVDFIAMRRDQGETLEDAVVEAGAVRFRPMVLTALSVVAGAFVILFDPIFQGLAISLLAGEVAATLSSRAWSCRSCIIWINVGKSRSTRTIRDNSGARDDAENVASKRSSLASGLRGVEIDFM